MIFSLRHATCLPLVAIITIATGSLRAQDPPKKVDWDEAAANLVVAFFSGGYIGMPQVDTQKELTVAVVGDNRFGRAVIALAANKRTPKPQDAPIRIVQITDKDLLERKDEWSACHVVVFATDDDKVQTQALAIMAGSGSLLVGRTPGFVAAGGHLNFWLGKDNKPHYELDHKAVIKLGIKPISAVVKSSRPEPRDPERREPNK